MNMLVSNAARASIMKHKTNEMKNRWLIYAKSANNLIKK